MCDDATEAEAVAWLTRRRFTALGAGAIAAAALPGCASAADHPAALALTEHAVAIETPDGRADGFFVHPSAGKHPAVLMWPDVAGLREAYRTLGRQLARAGFAVLVANHYYRSSPAPLFETMEQWRTTEGRARIEPMRQALTPAAVARDAAALVAWVDRQPAVDTARGIGTNGYCMTGPYTIRAAAAAPARVKAGASFHAAGLVEPGPDSPHLMIPQTRAAYLFAIAENDDARQPDAKNVLRRTCAEAGRPATIEVFPAQHGWCTPDSPAYDPAQQARAWAMMLDLFRAL